MKKIIYSLLIILLLSFILTDCLNYKVFEGFFFNLYWNSEYKWNKFEDAIKNYNKSLNFLDKKATDYHNIWNSLYRLWEKTKDDNTKKSLWEKSISNYKKALDEKSMTNPSETENNYLFVLDKLKKLNEKNEDNSLKQNSSSWKSSEESSWSTGNKDSKSWTNSSQWFKNFWDSKETSMTDEQRQELQKYSQYLKDFQKQNEGYVQNSQNNTNSIDNMINKFFKWDPNFDSTIPDNSNWGRDW